MPDERKQSKASASLTHVKDARGRLVTQLDPVGMNLLRRYDRIPAEALREIAEEVGTGLTKTTRWLVAVSAVCTVLVTAVAVGLLIEMYRTNAGLGWLVRKCTPFFGVWTGPFLFWLGAKRMRFNRIRSTMLKYLRCPHCGYDLRMLPRAPEDGLTVCPECGCAWRLDDSASSPDDSAAEPIGDP